MPRNITVTFADGTSHVYQNAPDDVTPDSVLARAQKEFGKTVSALDGGRAAPAAPKPIPERTYGEAATDVAGKLISGTGSLVQLPGQLYGLATGDFSKTGLLGAGEDIQKYGESMLSPALKAKEEARAQKIAESEKTGQLAAAGTAFSETVKDPALLVGFLVEQLPNLIPALLTGGGTAALTAAGLTAKEAAALVASGAAKDAAQIAAKEIAAKKAGEIGTKAAVGMGAVQQGADVGAGAYEDIYKAAIDKGMDPAKAASTALNAARAAGASGALISLLAQRLPGAKTLEETLSGVPGKTGRLLGAGKGFLGESASEAVEEGGGKFSQNLAMREVNPEQSLTEGLGQAAGMAAIGGGGMGAIAGAARRPEVETKPVEPQGQPKVETLPPAGTAPVEAPPEVPTAAKPAAPPPPPEAPKVEFKPADAAALANYTEGLPKDSADVFKRLQNRDRATPASIQQMQGIASNPDYDRLKTSPDFGSGAPVVISDVQIPEGQMGRQDIVTASDGRKIPVQYAVVDAGDLLTSHTASGQTNPDYGNVTTPGIRAVAGNGRIAGLQAAYNGDMAADYRIALEFDTQHGVDQGAILNMQNPVLVRVMPKSYVTPDIGDVSNVAGQLRLNPVEAAKNDVNRFDLQGLQYNEDGGINANSVIQFIKAMPKEEQGELMDGSGAPNSIAYDRLNNAVFYKAYGSDSLIDLYAQAADPEAKLILQALAKAAPSVSQLEGTGQYDIRKNIIEAAELAVNARRQDIKLKDFVRQGQIDMDPNTLAVLEMFAEHGRSGKRMGEFLGKLAEAASKAHEQSGVDMFGNETNVPLSDVFKALKGEAEPDLFTPPTETKPAEPTKPTEATKPAEPTKPTEIAKPAAPKKPVEPKKPAAKKPAEPKKPVEAKPEKPKFTPESKLFEARKSNEQIAKEVHGLTVEGLAKWAVDNAPNSAAKAVAEKVYKLAGEYQRAGVFPSNVEVKNGARRKYGTLGYVTKSTYLDGKIAMTITLSGLKDGKADGNTGTRYITILHELLHTVTVAHLDELGTKSKEFNDLSVVLTKVKKQIKQDSMKAQLDSSVKVHPIIQQISQGANTVKNVKELVAWGLTSPEFQDYLSKIQVGKTNAMDRLVQIFRKLLGIDPQYETALDAVVRSTGVMLDVPFSQIQKDVLDVGKSLGPRPSWYSQPTAKKSISPEVSVEEMNIGNIKAKASAALQKREPLNPADFKGVPQEFLDKANPVYAPQHKTVIQRLEEMKDRFWQRIAQGVADQFRTIREISEEAYMMARMSKTVDGALEGIMFHGHVFNDGGALNIATKNKEGKALKGFIETLRPLGNEVGRYQMWIALNREASLPKEKRSVFIDKNTGEDVMPYLVENRGTLIDGDLDGKPRKKIYESVQIDMNKLNRSVLKVALDAGLIDSTANAIERLNARIQGVLNNDKMSDAKKEDEIADLEAQIEELKQNPIGYERFAADMNYIPFYREMEDGDVTKVMTATGLSNQHFSKALEGGTSPFADLMENTLRNWNHILSASMKNQAAVATLNAANSMGGAEPNLKVEYYMIDGKVHTRSNDEMVGDGSVKPWMTTQGSGTIRVMVDGQPTYYRVLDPLLLDSISAIGYMGPKSKFLDVARDFKNMLQFGVTVSPAFKVRNLFRDSVAAMAVSDVSKSPYANVVQGWIDSDRNNPAHISALAGGAIFNFGSIVEGDQAKLVKRLVKQGVNPEHILNTPAKIKEQLKKYWDKYEEWGNKSESANRMALYQQLKEKNYSHLEASYYARDLLDFSMQGSWPAFRLLTQVVPFLNARVQGLYKLGRDGINPTVRVAYNSITGKPIWETDDTGKLTKKGERDKLTDQQKAASFSVVTGAVCLASLALYFAFKDDDEFKKRDEWDRDNFWWIKLPGMDYALRIPKPFEIGAFGTIAERTAEQIFDQGAEGKQFQQSMGRMVTDTFAFNLPQFMKPLVDLYANKDSFTGAPIESAGMERLSKQERMTESTSPLAAALGGLTSVVSPGEGLSPVQVDYAIKAYFGWLGGTIAETSHYAVMPFKQGAYPDTKWVDRASVGFIKSLPSNQSKYATAFYESNKEISQAYADMRHYAEIGDSEKVLKILEEKRDKIGLAKFYDKTAKNMAHVRLQIRVIKNDLTMSGAAKEEEIDRLKELISMMAKQAEDTRKAMK